MTPTVLYINLSKLAADIRTTTFTPPAKKISLPVDRHKTKIYYAININKPVEVSFCYFDFVVSDALYSLYQAKKATDLSKDSVVVSLGEILRIMSGHPNQTLTATKKNMLRASIEKLMSTHIIIDFSNELKQRNIESTEKCIEGFLAPLEVEKTDSSGEALSYRFVGEMPLYRYASNVNRQIARFPVELMRTSKSDTIEAIEIKHYLIRRLERLRNPKNRVSQPKISYIWNEKTNPNGTNGLLSEVGIIRGKPHFASLPEWRQKVCSVDKTVRSILDDFKAKNYIYGYDSYDDIIYDMPGGITLLPKENPESSTKSRKKTKPVYVADPFLLLQEKKKSQSEHS